MEMSLGHPCGTTGNSCCPEHGNFVAHVFVWQDAERRYKENAGTALRRLPAHWTPTTVQPGVNASEEEYRQKARQSSRLSLKPEPEGCPQESGVSPDPPHQWRCDGNKQGFIHTAVG
jgi:hypothetical protein